METLSHVRADIIALNAENEPVLLVEVKAGRRDLEAAKLQLVEYGKIMRSRGDAPPYAMSVDNEDLQIFEWKDGELSEPVFSVPTKDILTAYEPEFSAKPIYRTYLTSLVEAWLRDIAYRWKFDAPPALEALKTIGLADRLHLGTTVPEYPLNAGSRYAALS